MQLLDKVKSILVDKEVRKFLIIFYTVGVIGLAVPYTFPLFKILIPYALVLNFFLLFYFHRFQQNLKTFSVFAVIYLLSFAIEAIGVETGAIFGVYHYGNSIGPKIFDTPLIIGLNWLFLVYTSTSILEKFRISSWIKVLLSSFIMVGYDIILEQVAPTMDMWYWADDKVPLQNYLAWFVLSLAFNSLIKIFRIKTQNSIAFVILMCQFVFFVALFVIYKTMH